MEERRVIGEKVLSELRGGLEKRHISNFVVADDVLNDDPNAKHLALALFEDAITEDSYSIIAKAFLKKIRVTRGSKTIKTGLLPSTLLGTTPVITVTKDGLVCRLLSYLNTDFSTDKKHWLGQVVSIDFLYTFAK